MSTLRSFRSRCLLWGGWVVALVPGLLRGADLPSPSQAAVDAAIQVQLISYGRSFSGGAHTNGAWFGGASITLAVASHAGNTTADARLLQQIRHTLVPGNEPTCNGGYPAQHERHATGMFVIAKNTPRIWDQLSAAEKERIDRIMKAALVANAFTTSDNNPYVKAGSQQYALDGDDNLNRSWNPNYREGMIGGVITGIAYFGGPAPTATLLAGYGHAAFTAELAANDLPNLHQTFNWKVANPTSKAPSGSAIEGAVRTYRYEGSAPADYMEIYEALVTDTYGRNVNAGLNGGAGIGGAGKIVSGAETLPNPGAAGMLKEFNAVDANGARSSIIYAYDGYRPHMTNQLTLIVAGLWQADSAIADQAATLMNVGNTDLWYKAEKGYIGYAKGQAQALVNYETRGTSHGFVYNRSLWDDVLKPFHNLPGGSVPPAEFLAGARIAAIGSPALHSSASATSTVVGNVPTGGFGTIVGGPQEIDGVVWWQAYFDSGLTGWLQRSTFNAAPATEYLALSAGQGWGNRVLAAQSGSFTVAFNMRPGGSGIDALVGLADGPSSAYSDLAAAVRLSPAGVFDARDGGAYRATEALAYQAGVTYRVRMMVNLTNHTYTVSLTPPGLAPVTVARDFAFRTEQASVTVLNQVSATAQTGSFTVSGIQLETAGGVPSAPTGLKIVPQD